MNRWERCAPRYPRPRYARYDALLDDDLYDEFDLLDDFDDELGSDDEFFLEDE
jgi:hypothetical protein